MRRGDHARVERQAPLTPSGIDQHVWRDFLSSLFHSLCVSTYWHLVLIGDGSVVNFFLLPLGQPPFFASVVYVLLRLFLLSLSRARPLSLVYVCVRVEAKHIAPCEIIVRVCIIHRRGTMRVRRGRTRDSAWKRAANDRGFDETQMIISLV